MDLCCLQPQARISALLPHSLLALPSTTERREKPTGNTMFSQPTLPTTSNRWAAKVSFSSTPLKASCNAICT